MYFVMAAHQGSIVDIATTDTAKHAVMKLLDAREQYSRAWVSDEGGNDLSMDDLALRAQQEKRND